MNECEHMESLLDGALFDIVHDLYRKGVEIKCLTVSPRSYLLLEEHLRGKYLGRPIEYQTPHQIVLGATYGPIVIHKGKP